MTMGLHTCGGLSKIQFDHSIKNEMKVLNFGCCYYMMGPNDYNISKIEDPLKLNLNALSLANRSHGNFGGAKIDEKIRVKFYRYAFQMKYEEITQKKE